MDAQALRVSHGLGTTFKPVLTSQGPHKKEKAQAGCEVPYMGAARLRDEDSVTAMSTPNPKPLSYI